MRSAIFCRVSTDNQEQECTSLQTQFESCMKYCHDKGYDVAYHFSEAFSGLPLERPKLDELRKLVRNDQIDVVVIYCLDRLSRNATHGVIIRDELDKHHVTLESATEETVEAENERINKERSILQTKKADLEARIEASHEAAVSLPKLEEYVQQVRDKLTTLDFDMKRLALDMLNIKVWVDGSDIEITGAIPAEYADVVTKSS